MNILFPEVIQKRELLKIWLLAEKVITYECIKIGNAPKSSIFLEECSISSKDKLI